MVNYIIRRLIQVLITVWIIVTIVFIAVRLAPGDPAQVMIGRMGSMADYETIRSFLGLDRPFHVQYYEYISGLLKGDLGESVYFYEPVLKMILYRIPYTLQLALLAVLSTIVIGVPLGIYCSVKQNSLTSFVLLSLAYSGQATAEFWLAILLVFIFAVKLRILPSFGAGTLVHIILPTASIAFPLVARVIRFVRSGLLDIMQEDFIRTARSKGLDERVVLYKHALRNILIPLVTDMGLQFGWLLGGVVVVEAVFKWPGLGSLLVAGALTRDYPLIQGCILVFAFLFLFINLLIDILYTFIDPRISYSRLRS